MSNSMKGLIKSQRRDRKGFQLEDGFWYSSKNVLAKDLNRGSEVEFEYTVNEAGGRTYYNITDGTFKITKAATFPSSGRATGGGGGSYQKKDSPEFEAGVTAGVAINNACLLIAHGKADISSLPELARKIAGISKQLKAELKEGGGISTAPQQPAPKQSAPAPQPQITQDDIYEDVPF